ncbi:Hypothetical_protein [Hexamita inflata]|uniref:Hypothetical_protein n=1 Tax=Hexamita inflata TaxID=28002 RepID=A0AA86PNW4_9EUKA|nr:Hypothetical protein HINF_LOCUS18874 [Hexamita inflata]CAI9931230.1 Hypothetical protein HINF_LOCUS18875 [Hexamita inflata]CAI9942096.1 Hypothetical protein HINF_LOCUS29741 [Hexamita inflata]CAI9942097.1 Hypothetical protein HINF_LOCUS29742 [Hexamita inflata]CAI9942098.1 Hypothetical protein HINF_LOCUS29743 [Hexamita inflata]
MQIILTQQERDLTEFLSRLLNTSCPIQLSHTVLAFPDPLKIKLFQLVSLTLNIDIALVNQLFKRLVFKSVQTLRLQCQNLNSLTFKIEEEHLEIQPIELELQLDNQSNENSKQKPNQRCYNLLENSQRTQSKEAVAFQNRFAACLQQILKIQETNNRVLCEKVVRYLEEKGSKKFWVQMQLIIPEKSTVQLREYFLNSFKRFMHQEYLNKEDKVLLKELIYQMKNKKPSEIADKFIEMTADRNYFKRNVVMYIVNIKDK